MSDAVDTDILVVGAGPCGMTMANLLGTYGVRAVVIDRETEIIDYPRAVGIDDESLRTCQAVGLVDELLVDMLQNMPIRYYTSWGRCFAHVKPSVQPYGWPRRNLFMQPRYEASLRKGVQRFPTVDVRLGHELVGFTQDADGMSADVVDTGGERHGVRARFLVGADGGRSTVRHLAGIELTGATAPMRWLVVDVADDHLDAPFSAVYCHSQHPVLMVPLPYGHRRFEFKLQPDDDEQEVTRPEHVMALLAPRYGAAPLPTIVRARVYLHHSRIAARFQADRAFLVGDAAHLQPPFFGQGMNSGIRDVFNLAWKLAAVTRGRADDAVLATYDVERRGHAAAMVSFATRMGRLYRPHHRVTERMRDIGFRALQVVPGGKEYILQMKYKPMPRYTSGIVTGVDERAKDDPVGRLFVQPAVETTDGRRVKLDDVLGAWFAVLGIHVDPADGLTPEQQAWWRALDARFVSVDAPHSARVTVEDVKDVDGAFRGWLLAHPGAEIIILRPDRYVAAVCTRSTFGATTEALRTLVGRGGLTSDEAAAPAPTPLAMEDGPA